MVNDLDGIQDVVIMDEMDKFVGRYAVGTNGGAVLSRCSKS